MLIPAAQGLFQLERDTLEDLFWFVKGFVLLDTSLKTQFTKVSDHFDAITRIAILQLIARPGYVRTLFSTFHDVFQLNSSVADKLNIAINMVGLPILYAAAEKSEDQCRWILSVLALSAGDASAICGVGGCIKANSESETICWLRWTDDIWHGEFPELPKQSHIARMDYDHISLDLLFLVKLSTIDQQYILS